MSEDIEIRFFQHGDEEEIVSLLRSVFDGWPHYDIPCPALDHWRWKYFDNPIGKYIISLAVSEGRIIGCFHSPLLNVKIGESNFLCSQGGDQAVHPDFRRMGVYTRMRELAQEGRRKAGVKFHFSGSIVKIMIEGSIKRNEFRFPHDGKVFVRVHDIGLHMSKMPDENHFLNKYGFHMANFINRVQNTFRSSRIYNPNISLRRIERFDDEICRFWDKVKESHVFIVERSKDYLNWRYCDPRAGEFRVTIAEDEGIIVGYSVLKINRFQRDYPVGWIADFLTLPNRGDAVYALVEDAASYFDENNVNISICLVLKGALLERVLSKYGFLNSRQGPFMVYVPHVKDNEDIRKFQESSVEMVHNVFGDYDWI